MLEAIHAIEPSLHAWQFSENQRAVTGVHSEHSASSSAATCGNGHSQDGGRVNFLPIVPGEVHFAKRCTLSLEGPCQVQGWCLEVRALPNKPRT